MNVNAIVIKLMLLNNRKPNKFVGLRQEIKFTFIVK